MPLLTFGTSATRMQNANFGGEASVRSEGREDRAHSTLFARCESLNHLPSSLSSRDSVCAWPRRWILAGHQQLPSGRAPDFPKENTNDALSAF